MKMRFDRDNRTLEVKDDLKMHFMLLRFIFAINIFNALLRMYNNYLSGIQNEPVIIILGVISVIALLFMRSRSTQEMIPLDEIEFLQEKKILGRNRYSLKLKNGKIRNLPIKKKELDGIEHAIKESGIEIIKPKS
jgi:hypothetical protein